MIDSIHIRLHNIKRYSKLFTYLSSLAQHKYSTGDARVSANNREGLMFKLKMQYYDVDGKNLVMAKGETLTSSHYTLAFSLPMGGNMDYVDFQFSIPKLLYGTNVLQFVQHSREKNPFHFTDWNNYKSNQNITYRRLRYFIKHFFERYLYTRDQDISPYDVEIRRIDITWNQLFNDKQAAMEYLNYQKKLEKKHRRLKSAVQKSYTTSIFYNTRDYACKIYHKGSEYESPKGEKRKHKEANKEMEHDKGKRRNIEYDVGKIQALADRILRYEITFRASYLSKMFWSKVFRKRDKGWKEKMKRFKEINRIYNRSVAKKIDIRLRQFYHSAYMGKVDRTEYQTMMVQSSQFKYIDLSLGCSKSDRNFHKWWLNQRQRRVSFRMKVHDESSEISMGLTPLDIDYSGKNNLLYEALFSNSILRCCFKVFNDFRDHFEIKEKTYLSEAEKKVEAYNTMVKEHNEKVASGSGEKRKQPILISKIKSLLAHLNNYSLDELVQQGIIGRTSAYYYKQKFKELGVNYKVNAAINIWNCRGFEEYHRTVIHRGFDKYLPNLIFW